MQQIGIHLIYMSWGQNESHWLRNCIMNRIQKQINVTFKACVNASVQLCMISAASRSLETTGNVKVCRTCAAGLFIPLTCQVLCFVLRTEVTYTSACSLCCMFSVKVYVSFMLINPCGGAHLLP